MTHILIATLLALLPIKSDVARAVNHSSMRKLSDQAAKCVGCPKTETVTLWEMDTVCWKDLRSDYDTLMHYDTVYFIDTCRIDTIPRTFIFPEWLAALRPKPKKWVDVGEGYWRMVQWLIDDNTRLMDSAVAVRINQIKPRVDTVRIVDTVFITIRPHIDTTWGKIDSIRTCDNCDYSMPRRSKFLRSEPDWMHRDSGAFYYDLWQKIERIDTVYEPCGAVRTRKDGE